MTDAKRDANSVTTLLALSNADGITPVTLWADPVTHRLLVDASGLTGFATTALDNLASVAINTSLLLGTSDGGALGSATKMWSDLFLASGAVINFNNGDVTITHASNALAFAGGTVSFDTAPTVGASAVYYAGGTDVAVADGGTGKSSWTQWLIPYADTTTSFAQIAIGTAGQILTSNGAGAAPTFQNAAGGGASTALDNLSAVAINAALVLGVSDAFALGSATKQWADLFLAEGAVINWDNGDVTITQTGNVLTFAGAATRYEFDANLTPSASDGAALGTSALMFSDLFLASGAVINFNNGDVTITHTSDTLTIAGGNLVAPLVAGSSLGAVTMSLGSDADGDIYYRNSNVLTRLPKGTSVQQLRMNAGATAPEWFTPAAGGGAMVFAGADLVESSSSSTTDVDLQSVTGLSIAVTVPVRVIAQFFYDENGAGNSNSLIGLKINSTTVMATSTSNVNIGGSTDTNGTIEFLIMPQATNYLRGVYGKVSVVTTAGCSFLGATCLMIRCTL